MKSDKKPPFAIQLIGDGNLGMGVGSSALDVITMMRALTKAGINFIGYKMGIDYLYGLNLKKARDFVNFGTFKFNEEDYLKLNINIRDYGKAENHSIYVFKKDNFLVALVSIFNNQRIVILHDEFYKEFEEISYLERY